MRVIITTDLKQKAEEEELFQKELHKDSPTQRNCGVRQDYIAALGEHAFEAYLKTFNKRYEKHERIHEKHKGDGYDFKLWGGDKLHLIDVKASAKYKEICLNPFQRQKALKNQTILVGAYVNERDGYVEIFGYAHPSQLTEDNMKAFSYKDKRTGEPKKFNLYTIPPNKCCQFDFDGELIPT